MKQPEDNLTIDMLGEPLTTQGATPQATPSNPNKFCFRFYIRTLDGAVTEWTGLTAKRAKDMYAYTAQSQPSNVSSFGWEELK